jgi:hypothetical protein
LLKTYSRTKPTKFRISFCINVYIIGNNYEWLVMIIIKSFIFVKLTTNSGSTIVSKSFIYVHSDCKFHSSKLCNQLTKSDTNCNDRKSHSPWEPRNSGDSQKSTLFCLPWNVGVNKEVENNIGKRNIVRKEEVITI